MDFFVNVQPSSLFSGLKPFHDLFEVGDHFLTDALDKMGSFGGGGHSNFTAILLFVGAQHVTEFLKALNETRGGGGAVGDAQAQRAQRDGGGLRLPHWRLCQGLHRG